MNEPPQGVDPDDVLRAVRRHWLPDAERVTHLAVGFGAHHWTAEGPSGAVFVTRDPIGARHDRASIAAAYAGARALADAGLEFVHAGLEPVTVAFGDAVLSATAWLDGASPERLDVTTTAAMLARLHAAAPPPGIPHWAPLVGPALAEDLAARTATPWTTGPHGEQARAAIGARLDDIARWTADYHRLHTVAVDRPWGRHPRRATPPQPGRHGRRRGARRLGVAQARPARA